MTHQLHEQRTICASVFTQSNLVKTPLGNELGSKLFVLDLQKIASELSRLSTDENDINPYFYPFFPAQMNSVWEEDFFFQIFLEQLVTSQWTNLGLEFVLDDVVSLIQLSGYRIIAPIEFILAANFSDLLVQTPIKFFHHLSKVEATFKALIRQNIQRYLQAMHHVETADLIKLHALSQAFPYIRPPQRLETLNEDFLQCLSVKIREFLASSHQARLRSYQTKILTSIYEHRVNQSPSIGSICMATGTGKTYIQVYLAICALLTGNKRPVIIVTPQQQLVKQAYEDFMSVLSNWSSEIISSAFFAS